MKIFVCYFWELLLPGSIKGEEGRAVLSDTPMRGWCRWPRPQKSLFWIRDLFLTALGKTKRNKVKGWKELIQSTHPEIKRAGISLGIIYSWLDGIGFQLMRQWLENLSGKWNVWPKGVPGLTRKDFGFPQPLDSILYSRYKGGISENEFSELCVFRKNNL